MNYSALFDMIRNLYALPAYYSKTGKAPMPLRYFFELTYRCNLQCPYCYVGNSRQKQELTTQEWYNLIAQIPFYSIVTLVGGEPLLRKDFIEILEKACIKTQGKVNTVTNGILINDEIIDAFIKTKMVLLSVSLDGFGKTHDENRNKNGIFDKITNNLENLNSRKKRPMVDIKTIVLKNNLDDLPKLYKYCTDMNFEFLSISFLRNNEFKQNSILNEEFIPEFNQNYPIKPYFDIEHFKEIYKEIQFLAKKSKTKIRFSPKFEHFKYPVEAIENFYKTPENKAIQDIYSPCKFPCSNTFITPEGNVYPCLSIKMGNIKETPLIDIFNCEKYCHFRQNLKKHKLFGACQMCCELQVK